MADILITALAALLGVAAAALAALVALAFRRRRAAERIAPPLGERITVETPHGAGVLHYAAFGAPRPDRRPVVLIHGAGGSLRHFTHTLTDALAETDRVIAVDRPGAGYSAPPALDALTLSRQADFLRRGLAALDVRNPVLVGHSFGGSVALAYALDHPDDVAALVLLAPGAYPFTPKPPAPQQPVTSALARKLLAWTVLGPAVESARDQIAGAVFSPQTPPSDFNSAGGAALATRPEQLLAALTEQATYQEDLGAQAARYGALTLPITVLFGERDAVGDAATHADPLAAAAARACVVRLPTAGHMLPYAEPDACLDAIRAAAAAPAA